MVLGQCSKYFILFFSSRYWDVSLPWVRSLRSNAQDSMNFRHRGFPHSDIVGSKVARHLPDAYRSQATSFIAFRNQGIHHTPLCPLLENAHNFFFDLRRRFCYFVLIWLLSTAPLEIQIVKSRLWLSSELLFTRQNLWGNFMRAKFVKQHSLRNPPEPGPDG